MKLVATLQQQRLREILSEFHSARVLVVGDLMLDRFVYGSISRISPEAPVPVIAIDRSEDMPGGAANVARNIAMLGGVSTVIGVTGDDQAGLDLCKQLGALPSVKSSLIRDCSRPTTVKVRYLADRQHVLRTYIESTSAIAQSIANQVIAGVMAALDDVDVVVVSDYAKGLLCEDLVREICRLASIARREVIVDPKSADFARYSGASVITPNRQELQRACGFPLHSEQDIIRAGQMMLENDFCRDLLVTRGGDGMTLFESGGAVHHLKALTKEVFDVSGAGDTVIATLALARAAGATMLEGVTLANLAAGIVVGKAGTAATTPIEMSATLDQASAAAHSCKVLTRSHAIHLCQQWKSEGLNVGFTNGCFDLLHPGHVSLLQQARCMVDRLVVGVNSDHSVSRLKGPSRPIQSEMSRATILASLRSVDAVVVFAEDTPLDLIRELQPDVLIKGGDYTIDTVVGAELVSSWGGRVALIDLVDGYSTTRTVEQLMLGVRG